MIGNFINIYDIKDLLRILVHSPNKIISLGRKIVWRKESKIKKAWEHAVNPPDKWWNVPEVRKRWNYIITGDQNVNFREYIAKKYLSKGSLNALSLGCGYGLTELEWAKLGVFKSIDAYDLSENRIKQAAINAKQKGFSDVINFHVGDVNLIDVKDYYDVVIAEGILHHLSLLNEALKKINKFLKPNGYLIINEFVGPTRFQWTKRQLEVINGLLSIIPSKYTRLYNSNLNKPKVFKPSLLRMILSDPSEAVESSKISPLLYEAFDVLEVKEFGGTILHLLFDGIAQNFLSEDIETKFWLKICFDVEDQLLMSGDIKNDFIVVVCKKA